MTNNELIELAEKSGFSHQYSRNANFLFEKFSKLLQNKFFANNLPIESERYIFLERAIELLTDARDDIADKVYLNSQMLPYKQGRYDASVKQLADIDALLAEIEKDK